MSAHRTLSCPSRILGVLGAAMMMTLAPARASDAEAYFEEFARRPEVRRIRAEEAGRIASGDTVAVFTALWMSEAPPRTGQAVGIHVELSRTSSWLRHEVFLGPEEIRLTLAGIGEIVEHLPGYLERSLASDPQPRVPTYFGARQFRRPSVGLLQVAFYRSSHEAGLALGRNDLAYHFPGRHPAEVQRVLERGVRLLGLEESTRATR